jgi:hypothetical protein
MNTQMTEKQEKAMSKTARALTEKQATLPITNYENPWLEAAAEGGNELGKLLKFVKGEWLIGNDVIPDGSEYLAYINQLIRGWVRFEDGQVTDRRLSKIADGFKPQPREELPDNDPANWPDKDSDDNPRDPWSLQWYLPLVAVESGEFVTFVTGSVGGNDAVCDLCRIYGHKMRDGLLPIVALRTRSYKHKKYGPTKTPELQIVGWDGGKTEAAAIPAGQIAAKAAADNSDMDDKVPF